MTADEISERISWLIKTMCRDLKASKKDVIEDIEGLAYLPPHKQVDVISEIWMSYS